MLAGAVWFEEELAKCRVDGEDKGGGREGRKGDGMRRDACRQFVQIGLQRLARRSDCVRPPISLLSARARFRTSSGAWEGRRRVSMDSSVRRYRAAGKGGDGAFVEGFVGRVLRSRGEMDNGHAADARDGDADWGDRCSDKLAGG